MSSMKEVDEKLSNFWKYIERNKVMDRITDALSDLYNEPEKPYDIFDYFREKLGDRSPPIGTVEALKKLLDQAKEQIKNLENYIQQTKKDIKLKKIQKKWLKEKKKEMADIDLIRCVENLGVDFLTSGIE